jgi:dolichol-phosphate mannosyltransferase
MDLYVIIPAKDEEGTIAEIVQGCRAHTANVWVLDGCSTDRTREVAEDGGAKVYRDTGKGKGAAIRQTRDVLPDEGVVVFIDADGSHDPAEIPKLAAPIQSGTADHVTGSRLLGGSEELHGTFNECLRLMGSSFITACINARYKVHLSDSQNGFRALRIPVFKQLCLRANSTTIEQEMIMRTLKQGFRMSEVPAHEYRRRMGKSSIRLRKVFLKYGWSLVRGMI